MKISIHIYKLFLVVLLGTLSIQSNGQVCISTPVDLTWNCGDENWEYVYSVGPDVFAHQCISLDSLLDQTINLQVDIQALNCGDIAQPNVVSLITRTFSTSAPGQVSSCGIDTICAVQTIYVVDFEAPTFTDFPVDTVYSCENWDLMNYLLSGLFDVDFNDNCGPVDQVIDLDTIQGVCAAESQFQWEFTLTDGCNNTRIDTHIVDVVDTIGPMITFIPPIPLPVDCKALVVWPEAIAVDACSLVGDVVWGDVQEDSLSCPNHWLLSRWAYAEDECGNQDSALYEITVHDVTPPDITYVPLGLSLSCEDVVPYEMAVAVDGCLGEVTLTDMADTIPGTCPQNYTIQRTFTATDNCFNTSTALQLIVVGDVIPPSLTAPDSYQIDCSEAVVYDPAIYSDNCDPFPGLSTVIDTISQSSTGTYTLERTFTVTDACGNSSTDAHTITVIDSQAPYFTSFPADITIPCGETYPEDWVVFEDACDPAPTVDYSLVEDWQDCASDSRIYRTFELTDDAGNSFTQTQTISFEDNTAPTFTFIPADYTVECPSEMTMEAPTFADDCSYVGGGLTTSEEVQDQTCNERFNFVRTFTIEDACGNQASAEQTITVWDDTAPQLSSPLDSVFYHCSFEAPSCDEMAESLTFSDNCDSQVSVTSCEDIHIEGDCENQQCVWERHYYFEDACGNSNQASHFVTISETVFAPTMPTGMTPNSDGKNDAYVILDIGPLIDPGELAPCDWVPDTYLRVINRWGQVVYEVANYRNDWEGTNMSGEPLPSGTYFVIFEAAGVAHSTYVDIRR